jgi:catechol 2,3-dioxygenase-like lactoylglutathione lyase family enzyme
MGQKYFESLDHIQIPVVDVEQSIEWYTKHLGFYLHG